MARPRKQKLKVYRTPIGFHDAYVAAPSQKAALEAWGAESNLFARGDAQLVTDPELVDEPLQRPGEVIRRLRGSAAEQVKALGGPAKRSAGKADDGRRGRTDPQRSKRQPRPSRAALDKAERSLARAAEKHRQAISAIARQEEALARRRRKLELEQASERERLETAAAKARAAYHAAMADWSADQ